MYACGVWGCNGFTGFWWKRIAGGSERGMTGQGFGSSPFRGYPVRDNLLTALRLRYWRVVSRSEWPLLD